MKPILQAILLADHVYTDTPSGKRIIAGTFNRWFFKHGVGQPEEKIIEGKRRQVIRGGVHAGSPYLYLSLTEIYGEAECVVRYVNLERDEVFFQIEFKVKCNSPLETAEITIPFPPLPNIAGVYAVEVLHKEESLGSHRVMVEEIKESKKEE